MELRLLPAAGGDPVRLLWPFDRPRRIIGTRPHMVRRQHARHLLRNEFAGAFPCDGLRSAAAARIDLLPFQLEPALAVVSGRAHRLLLADAVGLGKTVQAGLVLAELHARDELSRGLIVTPPGLRDQWADELGARFGLDTTIVDLAWLRRSRTELAPDVNPWMLPRIAVVSYEFLKRPEILAGVAPLLWDVVVLDEAHEAAPGTDRAAGVQRVARHALRVLLLTATPHAGDEGAFRALCGIGAVRDGEPLVLFRRTREDVGVASGRRTRLLWIATHEAERRLHDALGRYAARVWHEAAGGPGARLAMEVLVRRASSSPSSLLRSLSRRLALLQDGRRAEERQLLLPLDPEDEDRRDEEPSAALATAGLSDPDREQRWLATLIDRTQGLCHRDAKSRRLERLLRRLHEPAIVFTEYRDTLDDLARQLEPLGPLVTLHGGLGRAERAAAIRQFTCGDARLLIATDAGGEGLNLHARCRVVINLELPWSPRRLEQRAGRVDRIGQTRRVHVVNLVSRRTSEARVLAALIRRTTRIRRAVGPIGDAIGFSKEAIARAVIGGETSMGRPGDDEPADDDTTALVRCDTRARGVVEAGRLRDIRRLTPRRSTRLLANVSIERQGTASGLPPGGDSSWLLIGTLIWTDGADTEVERTPVGFRLALGGHPRHRRDWRDLFAVLQPQLESALHEMKTSRGDAVRRWIARRAAGASERERAIAAALETDARLVATAAVQRGLFDRRADRLAAAHRGEIDAIRAAIAGAIAHHARATAKAEARVDVRLVMRSSGGRRF